MATQRKYDEDMKTKPWIAIDLFTNEILGNYASEVEAQMCNTDALIQYAPSCRQVKR